MLHRLFGGAGRRFEIRQHPFHCLTELLVLAVGPPEFQELNVLPFGSFYLGGLWPATNPPVHTGLYDRRNYSVASRRGRARGVLNSMHGPWNKVSTALSSQACRAQLRTRDYCGSGIRISAQICYGVCLRILKQGSDGMSLFLGSSYYHQLHFLDLRLLDVQ